MTYEEIKQKCKEGYKAFLPDWKGYFKWNYSKNQLMFQNGDYILDEWQLDNLLSYRSDFIFIT